jgi:hypothetical protein
MGDHILQVAQLPAGRGQVVSQQCLLAHPEQHRAEPAANLEERLPAEHGRAGQEPQDRRSRCVLGPWQRAVGHQRRDRVGTLLGTNQRPGRHLPQPGTAVQHRRRPLQCPWRPPGVVVTEGDVGHAGHLYPEVPRDGTDVLWQREHLYAGEPVTNRLHGAVLRAVVDHDDRGFRRHSTESPDGPDEFATSVPGGDHHGHLGAHRRFRTEVATMPESSPIGSSSWDGTPGSSWAGVAREPTAANPSRMSSTTLSASHGWGATLSGAYFQSMGATGSASQRASRETSSAGPLPGRSSLR